MVILGYKPTGCMQKRTMDYKATMLVPQKLNILSNLFMNISRIVGKSRRTSCILFT